MVQVKVKLEGGVLPEYKNPGDAGADVRIADKEFDGQNVITLSPGETRLLDLGLRVEIPRGWEIQVRSRSGLAKKGIVVANSPGTIDSGYRGPCMVMLHNQSGLPYNIQRNERIAQFVIKESVQCGFHEVDELTDSERGEGGFGSTGRT